MSFGVSISYLVSATLFILALKGLSQPATARRGNMYGIAGMAIAFIATLKLDAMQGNWSYFLSFLAVLIGGGIGVFIARKIKMTAMPQLVAAFHSLVGMSAVLVALAAFYSPESFGIGDSGAIYRSSLLEMGLGAIIGAITFSGSVVAFLKLQGIMSGAPVRFAGHKFINVVMIAINLLMLVIFIVGQDADTFWLMILFSFALGYMLIAPIGGADMPVVVSMLNSYSGWAAAGIGFTLQNTLLIITGALVGASGAILSYIMCKAMNRSLLSVIFGGFGSTDSDSGGDAAIGDRTVKPGNPDDAAFIMKNAESVIIVPGYGMAVAQAQHAVREMAEALEREGVKVRYAIHPVAGRMPGHMNVLLAEANVPYDSVFELEDINSDFASTGVVYVIGANDVTNPAAKKDPKSPIYGMPILDVGAAGTVIFVKRSMSAGYAGIDNELFYAPNTLMLFGDAKKVTESVAKAFDH